MSNNNQIEFTDSKNQSTAGQIIDSSSTALDSQNQTKNRPLKTELKKVNISFKKESFLGQQLEKWWCSLQDNRGERAVFRRAKSVEDVLFLSEFHRVSYRFGNCFNDMNQKGWEERLYRLAMILGLCSHIQQHIENKVEPKKNKLALQMAKPFDKPTVSELRFRRLIQRDRDELYLSMIRMLRILDNQANLHDLANSIYYWGSKVKREWAFAYFGNIKDNNKGGVS